MNRNFEEGVKDWRWGWRWGRALGTGAGDVGTKTTCFF